MKRIKRRLSAISFSRRNSTVLERIQESNEQTCKFSNLLKISSIDRYNIESSKVLLVENPEEKNEERNEECAGDSPSPRPPNSESPGSPSRKDRDK